jgi:MoaA/NifB/PqqE/SkfB family radical SAM enzyme
MWKMIRFLKFTKRIKEKKAFPHIINYDITSRCNLNCEHCYWKKAHNTNEELSDEEWEKAFLTHKKRGATAAYLTGGEPALRLNVIKIANRVFDKIGIISNGTIKIPEDIQKRIFISIDGPKEIHNKIRRADVFDKIFDNIQNDKRVILTPTLSTTNYRYIDELIEITTKSNVEGITFSTYTAHGRAPDPLLLEGDKLTWTVDKLREVWKKNKEFVLLTPRIINLFLTKEHIKKCFFLGNNFISFDAVLNVKKPCTLGKGVNCKTCGCIVPIISHAAGRGDIRAWFLLDRFFPERYCAR